MQIYHSWQNLQIKVFSLLKKYIFSLYGFDKVRIRDGPIIPPPSSSSAQMVAVTAALHNHLTIIIVINMMIMIIVIIMLINMMMIIQWFHPNGCGQCCSA